MSEANHPPATDILDRATLALRSAAASGVPPQQFVAATIETLNSRMASIDVTNPGDVVAAIALREDKRKQRIKRYGALVAVAALLIMATGIAMWLDRSATTAFAQVIKKVKEATSVVFTERLFISASESNEKPWCQSKVYLQGDLMRGESHVDQNSFDGSSQSSETISIGDWHTKKVLLINPATKTVSWFDTAKVARQFINPIEAISTLADNDGEFIGAEELNGRKTQVFKLLRVNFLTGGHATDLKHGDAGKVWIDAESQLPVKITAETSAGFGDKQLSAMFDGFTWNQPLDAKLFKLETPEGYKTIDSNAHSDANTPSAVPAPFPFSLAMKQVRQAHSISYAHTQVSEGQTRPFISKEFIAEDGRRRSELQGIGASGSVTTIFDANGFIRITLVNDTKTALVSEPRGDRGLNAGKMFIAWLQDLKQLGDKPDKELGQKELDGRTVTGFLAKQANLVFTIWVDVASGNLVSIEYDSPVNGKATHISMTDFHFNEPLGESLFSSDVPAGYQVYEPPQASKQ